jgi:hypothetical protein
MRVNVKRRRGKSFLFMSFLSELKSGEKNVGKN